jgi:abequosyltransferase
MNSPLLSIAIPTYNRSGYLKSNLIQLANELEQIENTELIEIIVSDNNSSDNTSEIITEVIKSGLSVRYHKNNENVGWGKNFLNCYNLANGKYLLILGDDDILYNGSLKIIIDNIINKELGIIFLRPYGYNTDYNKEYPGMYGKIKEYDNLPLFLRKVGATVSLISSCIVNKFLISDIDFNSIDPGNFAHVHLILSAFVRSKKNLIIGHFIIGCKRNNSSNYDFSELFVTEFWNIIDQYKGEIITDDLIKQLEKDQIFSYYPFYLFQQQLEYSKDLVFAKQNFDERFKGNFLYHFWLRPIITLPRFFAIVWGAITTFIGRLFNKEGLRGIRFFLNKIISFKRG